LAKIVPRGGYQLIAVIKLDGGEDGQENETDEHKDSPLKFGLGILFISLDTVFL
jgi:hypothetical protein